MSKFKFSPEFLDQLRELAVRWGKTAAERATAEVGSNPTMDFRDVEQLAALIAAGVTEGTVTTLLDKQAHALGEQPCPACGTCCPVNYLDRPLTLETGQIISMHEPFCVAAWRGVSSPSSRDSFLGLRLARVPLAPAGK